MAVQTAQGSENADDPEVDYFFDIPVDAAQRITGSRYDRGDVDGVELKFDVLERLPRRGGWLKSILGRSAG
jgi:hypothetical protein